MDRDNKFSGTLPLLAYAPQDFGLNAQRSRAYRARAAMGRTGVQPVRSHAQAPAMAVKAPVAERAEEAAPSSMFKKIWQRVAGRLKPAKNTEEKPSQVVAPVIEQTVEQRLPVRRPVTAPQPAAIQDTQVGTAAAALVTEDVVIAEARQTVSKTYAAMRKGSLSNAAEDQSIPQAPDLSHALAEIRQALSEHEKQANARQNENSSR